MNVEENYKQKIVSLISAILPNTKIYLFGSRATGKHSTGSDIDVALDTGEKVSRHVVSEIKEILSATNIPYKIDVVDIHSVPQNMCSLILKEGILWKS
jgi:predicted nucleotidyltransferase